MRTHTHTHNLGDVTHPTLDCCLVSYLGPDPTTQINDNTEEACPQFHMLNVFMAGTLKETN